MDPYHLDPKSRCVCATRDPAFCFQASSKIQPTLCIRSSHQASYTLTFQIVKEQIQLSELGSLREPTAECCRATDRARIAALTPDLWTLFWWSWTGSNRRPPACKAGALPIELQPRGMVGLDGFEPSTPALSRRCSNQLSYRPACLRSVARVFIVQPIGCGYSSCGSIVNLRCR